MLIVWFFFFFKQKTAYEMRISDWSSDVCSSDLLEAIFGFFTDPQQVTRLAAMRTGGERDYLYMLLYAGFLVSGCIALWRELRLRAMLAAALLPVAAALCEIGRASCRERGCQYV